MWMRPAVLLVALLAPCGSGYHAQTSSSAARHRRTPRARAQPACSAPQPPDERTPPSPEAVERASALLGKYDAGHREVAASKGAKGLGGALTANEWAESAERQPLAAAVRTLWEAVATEEPTGRLMLGICASDAMAGVGCLKAWVEALQLPKGPLHGMDREGVPIDMSTFGAVYIKYNSLPGAESGDPAGSARLSGYNGDFRGVYFAPMLADGVFRQYAVLPLQLFEAATPLQLSANQPTSDVPKMETPDARAVSEATAGSNTRGAGSIGQQRLAAEAAIEAEAVLNLARTRETLLGLPSYSELASLGVEVDVVATRDGCVQLSYTGPQKIRMALQMRLGNAMREADSRIKNVEFV